jgi:hypothetical protein
MVCPGPAGRTALTEGSLAGTPAYWVGGRPATPWKQSPASPVPAGQIPGQVLNATTHAEGSSREQAGSNQGIRGSRHERTT